MHNTYLQRAVYLEMMTSTLFSLLKGFVQAAKGGQRLPQCTLLLLLHLALHCYIFFLRKKVNPQNDFGAVNKASLVILSLNVLVNLAGYILLLKLYRHSVKNIFNKEVPPTIAECIPSFCAHLSLLRPLEVIFRFCTYRWRVLPDVLVLGEVRCGTTSLCEQLVLLQSNSVDCHTPFCLWAHPELDNKETFFFVGHYLGNVTPRYYSMCFPLKITKWFSETKMKLSKYIFFWKEITPKPFMTFDGCAQYLTSPSAPYLIAEAYRITNTPLPVLIVCVRDPADQAMSWWKYENNAIAWGEGMGLKGHNAELRGAEYPPKTIENAVVFSRGEKISKLYLNAENIFLMDSKRNLSSERKRQCILPDWAMTWPGGQLTGIGKNGNFVENINRYENVFRQAAKAKHYGDNNTETTHSVNVLPLKYLSNNGLLKSFLVQVLEALNQRQRCKHGIDFASALAAYKSSETHIQSVHRNSSATPGMSYGSVDSDCISHLKQLYVEQSKSLKGFCQERNIKWLQ